MYIERFSVLGGLVLLLANCAHAADTDTRLADAAERKDAAAVRALLEQGANVRAAQVDGMTALHWLVYYDDAATAALLLDAGADVNAQNRYGVAPLSLACTNGSTQLVDLLLKHGANPNTTLRGGETALMTAARTGRIGPVAALLERGAEVNAAEESGQTAIMWAAAEGHLEVVKSLLKSGADFRTPLDSGFTPLMFAARNGHTEVVLALLAEGADVNEAVTPNRSGRRSARGVGRSARNAGPLILAVENGHFELAAALLQAGADPNDMRSGFAPLHTVTWVRKPNRGDGPDGLPPPKGSGHMTSLQFVRELVAHGADVNARTDRGSAGPGRLNQAGVTPFLMACDTADVPLMRLLVELGADPLLPNADKATPLMAAAGLGTISPGEEAGDEAEALAAAKLAIELGGDVNAVDDNGETAMHGAAYKNLPQMVQFLTEQGAKVEVWNRKNREGWTPLHIARGYRPGNFKPSPDTVLALERVMRAAGVSTEIEIPQGGQKW